MISQHYGLPLVQLGESNSDLIDRKPQPDYCSQSRIDPTVRTCVFPFDITCSKPFGFCYPYREQWLGSSVLVETRVKSSLVTISRLMFEAGLCCRIQFGVRTVLWLQFNTVATVMAEPVFRDEFSTATMAGPSHCSLSSETPFSPLLAKNS